MGVYGGIWGYKNISRNLQMLRELDQSSQPPPRRPPTQPTPQAPHHTLPSPSSLAYTDKKKSSAARGGLLMKAEAVLKERERERERERVEPGHCRTYGQHASALASRRPAHSLVSSALGLEPGSDWQASGLRRSLAEGGRRPAGERFAVGRSLVSAKHATRGYTFCALCSTSFSVNSRVTDAVWPPYL